MEIYLSSNSITAYYRYKEISPNRTFLAEEKHHFLFKN